MAIRILRNNNGNCVTFIGSSQPAYWNACLSGEVNDDDNTRVNVINDIRTTDNENPVYEFFAVPFTDFQDSDGNSFADATECADYITEKANVVGGATEFTAADTVNFTRDPSLTTILTSLGDSFPVNGIKAVGEEDGTLSIAENTPTGVNLYQGIRTQNVSIEGQTQNIPLASLVNSLNSFFTVTPVGAGADDAFATFDLIQQIPNTDAFGDVLLTDGTATKGSNTGSQFNDGFYTSSIPINSPGEYFYIDNTAEDFQRKVIIGLLETSKFSSASTLSSITASGELLDLAVRLGPNTAYENSDYGVVIENGFYQRPQRSDVFRAGINGDGRLIIDHLKDDEWQTIVRSALAIEDGEEYMMVVHLNKEGGSADVSTVRTYSLSSDLTLNYRYIESPDGDFYYPLFSTRDEADYVSQQANTLFGGSYVNDADINSDGYYSHSHVFIDDPSNTTWYMPDNYAFHGVSSAPSNTAEITYTAIATEADSNYAPTPFSGSDFTFDENTSVNIQVTPAGAVWTTTVSGLPQGLSFDGSSLVTGTTPYVSADQTSTVTVARTNSYGTSTGTFDITISDNASLGTFSGWTQLGGNFVQPNRVILDEDALLQFDTQLAQGEEITYSYAQGSIPPTIGILSSAGETAASGLGSNELGSGSYDFADSANWDLRYVTFGGNIGGNNKHALLGWSDNTTQSGTQGDLFGGTFKLEYDVDGYIRLYLNGSLKLTSASTFSGDQTITMAGFDNQDQTDVYVPSNWALQNSAYGTTQPPSGFENPLLLGQMATPTLMGEAPDEDAAVSLSTALKINHRYIFPQTWIEANVLPYAAQEQSDMAFIGVPGSDATWGDVGPDDFDAFFRIQGTSSSTSYQSHLQTDSTTQDNVTINSLTDSYYDYALEWDGTDLHVIACNVGDINTEPAISAGGSFSRSLTETGYSGSGDLDVVIAVDNGAQVNLSTSGITTIRTPFGINDILVGEASNGHGRYAIQPAASVFDSAPSGHAPAQMTWNAISTLNAGTTYRFIFHPSMEADDTIEFRLASDNTTVYTTGITTFGSGDPDFTSAYKGIEFAVPTDAPPLTLYYYNAFDAAYHPTLGLPISISGSTYTAPVTGITQEGPAANQTGTNVMDAGDHGWISLDEQLSAGERLVLDNAFFADFLAETQGTNNIFAIGLKGDNWTNTKEVNNAQSATSGEFFKGNTYIVGVWSSGGSSVTMTLISNGVQGNSMLMNSSSLFGTACAFLEITGSGNNIRAAFGRNNSTGNITAGDESTVTYGNWPVYKGQTGEQGYGITSLDVVMSFWTYNGGAIDGNEIDWTGLSEVSVPTPAATLATDWTKALDFSGSSERTIMVNNSSSYSPLKMAGISSNAAAPSTSGYTSNDSNSRPWATAIVFNSDNNSSNQHVWNSGEGAGSTDDNIYLRVDASRGMWFGWGRSGALNECYLGTLSSTAGTWYGVYIASTGERLGSSHTASDIADCFDIRIVNLSTGATGTNQSTSSNWTSGSFGGRMNREFVGDMTIGGRGSNRNFHGKVAAMVVTTLRRNVAMPTDAEITMMVRDPVQWLTDYKVGNSFRLPSNSTDSSNFTIGTYDALHSTHVWLMGDGTGDAYAQIRNQVWAADQNRTAINMVSMISNDIQNVTISGLT